MTIDAGRAASEGAVPREDGPLPPFDWRVYADATGAGLARLVPLPLVDRALECLFCRRIPGSILRARGLSCDAPTRRELGRCAPWWPRLTRRGCLLAPFILLRMLLSRISRKLLYFLTLREASRSLVLYWFRATLIDHMARSGHLDDPVRCERAMAGFRQALATVDAGGLRDIARAVISETHFVLLRLLRARRRGAEDALARQRSILRDGWPATAARLASVVVRYESLLAEGAALANAAPSPTDNSKPKP